MGKDLVGINEIRQALGVSESTVMGLIQREGLPAEKIGGQWTISDKALRIWQDPELSTRKRAADKRKAEKPEPAAKVPDKGLAGKDKKKK